jgi:hypothetical protein
VKKREVLWYFLIIGTIFFCLRSFFLPGFLWKDDYVPLNPKFAYYTFFTWNPEEHAGTINELLPSSIFNAVYCLLASFSETALASKIYVITTITLTALCMFWAVDKLQLWYCGQRHKIISFFCSLFYAINPWTTSRILSGHFPLLMAYAIAPLFVIYCLKSLDTFAKIDGIKAAGLLSIIGMVSFHGFVLVSLSVVIIVCWTALIRRTVVPSFSMLSGIFLIPILLNAFWIFPNIYVLASGDRGLPQVSGESYSLSQNAGPLNVLRLMGYFWNPYERDIYLIDGTVNPVWVLFSFIFPILVSLSIFFIKSRRDIRIPFLLLFIVSVTLSQGTSLLGELYIHLVNFPFLQVLRDPNKIVFIASLSSCLILGLSLEDFSHAVKKLFPKQLGGTITLKTSEPVQVKTISCLLIVLILTLNFPWLSGDFRGYYVPQEIPPAYQHADEFLKNQGGDFRVLYLPIYTGCISFDWGGGINEPVRYLSGEPVLNPPYPATYELSPYTTLFMDCVSSALWNNLTRRIGAILGLANVKYVVARADVLPLSTSRVFLDSLSRQEDLTPVWSNSSVYIFENRAWLPKIRIASTPVTVVGGFKTLEKLPYTGIGFSNKVLFFPETDPKTPTNTSIFIDFDNFLDYLLSFSPKESMIDPRDYVDGKNWIIDSWLQTLSEDLCDGGVCARALSDEPIDVSFTITNAGRYYVFLRMYGDASAILIDGQDVRGNTTMYSKPGFHWLRCNLAFENGKHVISISKAGDLFGLDKIHLISETESADLQNRVCLALEDHSFILHIESESLYSYGEGYLDGALSNFDFSSRFAIPLDNGSYANLPADEYIVIPSGKKCYMNLRAGTFNDQYGSISIIFRNLESEKENSYSLEISNGQMNISTIELENLDPGNYFLIVKGNNAIVDFFDIYDSQSALLFEREETISTEYEQHNPTEYSVSISSSPNSRFLVFSASYTSMWNLAVNGKNSGPFHCNIFSMAFDINATEATQITLSFSPQYYSVIGWAVSFSTIVLLIVLLELGLSKSKPRFTSAPK